MSQEVFLHEQLSPPLPSFEWQAMASVFLAAWSSAVKLDFIGTDTAARTSTACRVCLVFTIPVELFLPLSKETEGTPKQGRQTGSFQILLLESSFGVIYLK